MQVTHWHSRKEIRTKETFPPRFPTRVPSRVKIIDGAIRTHRHRSLLAFPFSGWLRFPLWSKRRSPSRRKQKGNRTDIGPNNARRNFLSEIAVPNIIDNWYDTRLVALLEFYRDPTRERNCLSSRIADVRSWGYSGCPNIADTAHTTIHSSRKK